MSGGWRWSRAKDRVWRSQQPSGAACRSASPGASQPLSSWFEDYLGGGFSVVAAALAALTVTGKDEVCKRKDCYGADQLFWRLSCP